MDLDAARCAADVDEDNKKAALGQRDLALSDVGEEVVGHSASIEQDLGVEHF